MPGSGAWRLEDRVPDGICPGGERRAERLVTGGIGRDHLALAVSQPAGEFALAAARSLTSSWAAAMAQDAEKRNLVRSVAHLPEPLSASYRNRVLNLSPGNQNHGVKHLPGSHKRD